MMTLKELKAVVKVADERKPAPKHKELLEMGVNVVVKEVISDGVEITVFENGYVLFADGKRKTVFKLHECEGVDYESVKDKSVIFQSTFFENENWYVLLLLEVHPWKLDVDIEGTKKFYKDNDYSLNKGWNKNFADGLNKCQKEFFENLGIDLMNIEVEKHDFEENPEVPFIYSVNFLFCGKFLSMPEEQIEMYRDEEIYGSCFEIESVESVPCKKLSVYDGLGIGIGIRFKYPFSHFEDSRFEKWDCGFINGSVIVRGMSVDGDIEAE